MPIRYFIKMVEKEKECCPKYCTKMKFSIKDFFSKFNQFGFDHIY